jgi:hypothetical protein
MEALALDAIPAAFMLRRSAVEALRGMRRRHDRGLSDMSKEIPVANLSRVNCLVCRAVYYSYYAARRDVSPVTVACQDSTFLHRAHPALDLG